MDYNAKKQINIMKKLLLVLVLCLSTILVFSFTVDSSSMKSNKVNTYRDFVLPDESYIDDIPFNTSDVLCINTTPKLKDEEYIDDIPFNTNKIYYNITYGSTIEYDDIKRMPSRTIPYILSTFSGVYSKDTDDIGGIRGNEPDHTIIYLDGVRVFGSYNIPELSIDKFSVMGAGSIR